MSVTPLNFGVIGADRRGRISLLAHCPGNGQQVVAACSLTPERLGFYREQCGEGVFLTADFRELLARKEVDAVFVCSPDHLHEQHAIACMEAGKDVFLEKPMAISISECDHILQCAERTGRKLYVGHNMRFFPVMQKMKQLIDEGAIGEVQAIWCRHFISYGGDAYFRDWHSERRYSNGLLLQKGAHDIDIIHWLAGSATQAVSGMGKLSVYNTLPRRKPEDPQPDVEFDRSHWPPSATSQYSPNIDVEDHSMLLMQLENGVQATYLQCHYAPDDQRNYTVIGTSGRIENFGDHSTEENDATVHLWNQRTGYTRDGHKVFPVPFSQGGHGGADPYLIDDFVRFLRDGILTGATPIDARNAVAAACCGTESLRQDCGLRIVPAVASPRPASQSSERVAVHAI